MARGSSARSANLGIAAGNWHYPGTVPFEELLAAENAAIARLRANRAVDKGTSGAGQTRARRNVGRPTDKYQVKNFRGFRSVASDTEEKVQDTIGLALSGGGIRSAAFCLGTLQALDIAGVLRKIDYLSTVSGGGYIGTCMTASMQFNGGQFPFPSKLKRRESPSLQHIRDNSNYLFPNGPFDLFRNAAIYARGLIANFIIVGIFLFLAAGLTVLANPTPGDLEKPSFLASLLGVSATGLQFTIYVGLLVALLILIWGIARSIWRVSKEIGEPEVGVVAWALLVVGAVAFTELQPFVLSQLHSSSGFVALVKKYLAYLAPGLAASRR